MAPIIDWLIAQGADLDAELGQQLCGHMGMQPTEVRYLVDRGADPNWVAPNGIPVLEHAVVHYWNGEAIDTLVAAGARPRDAIWIAAGTGDVDRVARFLDASGQPTPPAFNLRLDIEAIGGLLTFPQLADATGIDILHETFLVAVLNGRTRVIEYLIHRGFPVNEPWFGMPWLNLAVGNGMADVAESLIRSGADIDLRGSRPNQSARELARSVWEDVTPKTDGFRRVAVLLGHDPDAILAAQASRPVEVEGYTGQMRVALAIAGDDAFAHDGLTISTENLFVGLLAVGDPVVQWLRESGADLTALRSAYGARFELELRRVARPALRFDPDAQEVMDSATAIAKAHRRGLVNAGHLLSAMLGQSRGFAVRILERHGADIARLTGAVTM